MRVLKIIMMYLSLTLVFITCQGIGLSYDKSDADLDVIESPVEIPGIIPFVEPIEPVKPVDCFEYAESVTGFSAEVLRGIAATESHFQRGAIGDDGMSLGMFQLHSRWHESRVKKWGEIEPADPFESAVIAARIMQENLAAFNGDLQFAIAAYKQGVAGVCKNGPIYWYVEDVLNWRNDTYKIESFVLFCGITDIEVLQDEYEGAGTQDTYTCNDSPAVQVSRRGSGSVPY